MLLSQVFGAGAKSHFQNAKVPPGWGSSDGRTANSQNGKSPLPGGQARRNKLLVSWGPLVIAAPLAGSLLAPLRCAAPCHSRSRATWPPSRYPSPSQAAFAPCVRSLIPQPAACLTFAHVIGLAAPQEVLTRRCEEIDHLGVFAEPCLVLGTSRNDHNLAGAADPLFAAEAELHLD